MIHLPPGFRIIAEEDLLRIADYLGRYCDNDCSGINCTESECTDEAMCDCDAEPCCRRDCLVYFAKEDLGELSATGEEWSE